MKHDIEDVVIRGEMVELKPIRDRHFKQFTQWYEKKRIRRHLLRDDLPGLRNSLRRFLINYRLRPIIQSIYQYWLDNGIGFMIKVRDENIGTICAWEIQPGIFRLQVMIGRRKHWGQKFGTEAIHILTQYLFTAHSTKAVICADIHPLNKRCTKAFANCGFSLCNDEQSDAYREMTRYPKHLINYPLTDSGKERLQTYELTEAMWNDIRK